MLSRLQRLHAEHGQSPWLDSLRRSWIEDGTLGRWVSRGVRGVTSNPTIFQQAIAGSDDYDADIARLAAAGAGVEDAYWTLVVDDITRAAGILAEVHASDPDDGFVSVELDPRLAGDAPGSVAAAVELHERIDLPNVYVKVPATRPGVDAIAELIARGRNVNVTLIFSLDRYREVMEAYLSGLERCPGDLGRVHSVASFFVSRVDTEVDRRLEAIGTPEALALRGTAAVANARLAYRAFRETFSGPRWDALRARGANLQRPLWASTSTKNPAYPDTKYVDALIGPDTVNTMPPATLEAFEDHGTLARTLDADPAGAARTMERLAEVGVDLDDVSAVLETQGVAAFEKSFTELLAELERRLAAPAS